MKFNLILLLLLSTIILINGCQKDINDPNDKPFSEDSDIFFLKAKVNGDWVDFSDAMTFWSEFDLTGFFVQAWNGNWDHENYKTINIQIYDSTLMGTYSLPNSEIEIYYEENLNYENPTAVNKYDLIDTGSINITLINEVRFDIQFSFNARNSNNDTVKITEGRFADSW